MISRSPTTLLMRDYDRWRDRVLTGLTLLMARRESCGAAGSPPGRGPPGIRQDRPEPQGASPLDLRRHLGGSRRLLPRNWLHRERARGASPMLPRRASIGAVDALSP
jgi:hypothetical protein